MIRLRKSKKGFTLVELVMVVAIIVILAAALWLNSSDILQKSKDASEAVDADVESMHNSVIDSENKLAGYKF